MIAEKYLNKRRDPFSIPLFMDGVFPPYFMEFIASYTLDPIFIPQFVKFERLNRTIEYCFSLNKQENEYLNQDGDYYLTFSDLETIYANLDIESIWNQNKMMVIGNTDLSQIFIGYGNSNRDKIFVDINYRGEYILVAETIFDFFKDLILEFKPILNNIEIEMTDLKLIDKKEFVWKYIGNKILSE